MSSSNIDYMDAFIRSGLAKSAFKPGIYGGLSWRTYIPLTSNIIDMLKVSRNIAPRMYQAHDALLMFLRPYGEVLGNLKEYNNTAALWHYVVSEAVKKPEFAMLNRFTAGSNTLATVAAVRFLEGLFKTVWNKGTEAVQEKLKIDLKGKRDLNEIQGACKNALGDIGGQISDVLSNVMGSVKEFDQMSSEALASAAGLAGGAGGEGFAKEALSVLAYLKSPDRFRERVRLLSTALSYMRHFMERLPTSLSHEEVVSQYGGINGVGLYNGKISDIVPSELAVANLGNIGSALFAVKLATRQLLAYQRAAAVKPVVFIDKSGSMAEGIRVDKDGKDTVPKISLAAGLGLALYWKFKGDVYLFDTELTKVTPREVVETLLKVDADGGTNIDPVIEEVTRINKPDYYYLIISDGITEASDEWLKDLEGLAPRTSLILIGESPPRYNWVELLKRYNRVHSVYTVAEFEDAVRRAFG
jgi:uncharacterized protein with von Willebrand factor type A (vWA) domain